tara:strand:+ start:81 stop:563 length:483 start_codon:yes stop_codon:yes gene_type:complete
MKKIFSLLILISSINVFAEDITLACEDGDANKIKIRFDSDSLEKNAFITSKFYFEGYTPDFTANVTVRYLGDKYFFYKIDYLKSESESKQCQIPDNPTPDDYLDNLYCELENKGMSEEESRLEVSLKIDRKSLVIQGEINSTRKGSFMHYCKLQNEEYLF